MLMLALFGKMSEDFLDVVLRMIEIVGGAFILCWLIYFLFVLVSLRLRKK